MGTGAGIEGVHDGAVERAGGALMGSIDLLIVSDGARRTYVLFVPGLF